MNTPSDIQIFDITVDHSLTPEEAVGQSGQNTTGAQENLEYLYRNMSSDQRGIVEYEARYFLLDQSSQRNKVENVIEDIISEDGNHPWQPAQPAHLLAFGQQHPAEQKKHHIFAPGSKIERPNGRPLMALLFCIEQFNSNRIALYWWDEGALMKHPSHYLAVRPKK